jgi:hypothetical protein
MKNESLLRALYSTTVAAKACGAKPKNVTNHISLKHIPTDKEASGSGTGHELSGYTIVRMAVFFEISRAMKFNQAARVIWPEEKNNEKAIADAVRVAVERYGKVAKTLLDSVAAPVQLIIFPGKPGAGWTGDIVENGSRAESVLYWDKPLSITVSISHAVKTVIENLRKLPTP